MASRKVVEAEPLVDAKVAARLLAMRVQRVWALLRQKPPPFPVTIIGRNKRFKLSDLKAWLDSKTVRP